MFGLLIVRYDLNNIVRSRMSRKTDIQLNSSMKVGTYRLLSIGSNLIRYPILFTIIYNGYRYSGSELFGNNFQ